MHLTCADAPPTPRQELSSCLNSVIAKHPNHLDLLKDGSLQATDPFKTASMHVNSCVTQVSLLPADKHLSCADAPPTPRQELSSRRLSLSWIHPNHLDLLKDGSLVATDPFKTAAMQVNPALNKQTSFRPPELDKTVSLQTALRKEFSLHTPDLEKGAGLQSASDNGFMGSSLAMGLAPQGSVDQLLTATSSSLSAQLLLPGILLLSVGHACIQCPSDVARYAATVESCALMLH